MKRKFNGVQLKEVRRWFEACLLCCTKANNVKIHEVSPRPSISGARNLEESQITNTIRSKRILLQLRKFLDSDVGMAAQTLLAFANETIEFTQKPLTEKEEATIRFTKFGFEFFWPETTHFSTIDTSRVISLEKAFCAIHLNTKTKREDILRFIISSLNTIADKIIAQKKK